MALEREMETYNKALPTLLDGSGKYVLIVGERVVDTYDTYEDALKAGYKEAKLGPFLVKQIMAVDKVQFISRHVEICQA